MTLIPSPMLEVAAAHQSRQKSAESLLGDGFTGWRLSALSLPTQVILGKLTSICVRLRAVQQVIRFVKAGAFYAGSVADTPV